MEKCQAIDYSIKPNGKSGFIFLDLDQSDPLRKVGHYFKFRYKLNFKGGLLEFFDNVVIKFWGEDSFNNRAIGFKNNWWQLERLETFAILEQNKEKLLILPAIIIAVEQGDVLQKKIFVGRKEGVTFL